MRVTSNKIIRPWLALVLAQALIVQGGWAQSAGFNGKVLEVIDGATIRVSAPEGERIVRLAGLEAAALDNPLGKEAREKLSSVLMGKTVNVRGLTQTSMGLSSRQGVAGQGMDASQRSAHYDRNNPFDGQVFLNGQDIATILLSLGLAWLIYSILQDNSLKQKQQEAMTNKSGVWASGTAVSSEGRPLHYYSPTGAKPHSALQPAKEPMIQRDVNTSNGPTFAPAAPSKTSLGTKTDASDEDYKQKEKAIGKKDNPGLHLGWDKKKKNKLGEKD
ncbi:MAG: thermonuclease family protein [Nitrospinota bacterium]|nr:thermonuclease family protein [Nitrospinota bacterium]